MKRKLILGLWLFFALLASFVTLMEITVDYSTGFYGGRFLPQEPNVFSYIKEANERASAREILYNGEENNLANMYNVPIKAYYPSLNYNKELFILLFSVLFTFFFFYLFIKLLLNKQKAKINANDNNLLQHKNKNT